MTNAGKAGPGREMRRSDKDAMPALADIQKSMKNELERRGLRLGEEAGGKRLEGRGRREEVQVTRFEGRSRSEEAGAKRLEGRGRREEARKTHHKILLQSEKRSVAAAAESGSLCTTCASGCACCKSTQTENVRFVITLYLRNRGDSPLSDCGHELRQ
jgi:hypothetical protein